MYKVYTEEEFFEATDKTANNVKQILIDRLNKIENHRDEINDYYPFEDLYLQMAKVDSESWIINEILKEIDTITTRIKLKIKNRYVGTNYYDSIQWRSLPSENVASELDANTEN